ncbi:MAG: type I restriction enzyme HsdR N-terminal domain-containing protein [Chitinophagaceae bacterium]
MVNIHYPNHQFKTKEEAGKTYLFDEIRKKWLLLTPEEWVRQHFVVAILQQYQYPAAYIALEKMIKLGELTKRFDLLVYNAQHQPWMLVECKAPQVALTEEVLKQILTYHIVVPVNYLVIVNGNTCFCWKKENGQLIQQSVLPEWNG